MRIVISNKMSREERIQAYMDNVVSHCKGNSERIVDLCTNNIKTTYAINALVGK